MEEYISVYTWKNAVDDGIFINISGITKDLGFETPVAITSNLFYKYFDQDQDECNIIDFLVTIKTAISNNTPEGNIFKTEYSFDKKTSVKVWATIAATSPTDHSLVTTIMLPEDY